MAKNAANVPKIHILLMATLGAWLVPGLGHALIGRPVRAIILFITIHGLFWSGVAIGGVFTVDPYAELWWSRAQLCTGASGVFSYRRQQATLDPYLDAAEAFMAQENIAVRPGPQRDALLMRRARAMMAEKDLVLAPPAAGPAFVFSGVAGMLNLLCIMDVILLCALGQRGEGPIRPSSQEGRS